MKSNQLAISINRPVAEVFEFTITPPNSTRWIPGVVAEATNEFPIRAGTLYTLTDDKGNTFEVCVSKMQPNRMIEWATPDGKYHCRYTYHARSIDSTELEYYEWMDEGDLTEPFTQEALACLKRVMEA